MSTNFYFGKNEEIHIGKRAGAGAYCRDCGLSLANESQDYTGKKLYSADAIHYSKGAEEWLEMCPICFTPRSELEGTCSFSFDITPADLLKGFQEGRAVFDEYGREYSKIEFQTMLQGCHIKYYSHIGHNFC